jgi:hypothetical protein
LFDVCLTSDLFAPRQRTACEHLKFAALAGLGRPKSLARFRALWVRKFCEKLLDPNAPSFTKVSFRLMLSKSNSAESV